MQLNYADSCDNDQNWRPYTGFALSQKEAMFKYFTRWAQLTFLFFIFLFAIAGIFMAPLTKGDWSRFQAVGAISAVVALLSVRRLARTAAMTRDILPKFPPGTFTGSGGGYSGWDDDDDLPQINPSTGLPMMDGGIDVGGNTFGCSDDD